MKTSNTQTAGTAPGKVSLKVRTRDALQQVATDMGLLLVDAAEHEKVLNDLYNRLDAEASKRLRCETELVVSDGEVARLSDALGVVRAQSKVAIEERRDEEQQLQDRIAVLETQLCLVRQSDDEAAHQARTLVLDLNKSLDTAADMIVAKDEVIADLEERLTARDRKVAEFREATTLSIQARDADRITIASLRAHNSELAIAKYERDEENTALKAKLAKVADELEMTEGLYDALLAEVNGEAQSLEDERDAVIEHFAEHVEETRFTRDYAGELETELEAQNAYFEDRIAEDGAYIAHLEAETELFAQHLGEVMEESITRSEKLQAERDLIERLSMENAKLKVDLSKLGDLTPDQAVGVIKKYIASLQGPSPADYMGKIERLEQSLAQSRQKNAELSDAVAYAEKLLSERTKERRAADRLAATRVSFDPQSMADWMTMPLAISRALAAGLPQ